MTYLKLNGLTDSITPIQPMSDSVFNTLNMKGGNQVTDFLNKAGSALRDSPTYISGRVLDLSKNIKDQMCEENHYGRYLIGLIALLIVIIIVMVIWNVYEYYHKEAYDGEEQNQNVFSRAANRIRHYFSN
jgi:hypothetical protein